MVYFRAWLLLLSSIILVNEPVMWMLIMWEQVFFLTMWDPGVFRPLNPWPLLLTKHLFAAPCAAQVGSETLCCVVNISYLEAAPDWMKSTWQQGMHKVKRCQTPAKDVSYKLARTQCTVTDVYSGGEFTKGCLRIFTQKFGAFFSQIHKQRAHTHIHALMLGTTISFAREQQHFDCHWVLGK